MTKFAIDFGTSSTKIFQLGSGNGIVLSEATCVTVDKMTGEAKSFGDEAKKVLGKAADTDVIFPEVPYLAALGMNVPVSESNNAFAIDVGAGKTSIAAFSLGGIIAGINMNVGGNNMDTSIIDHIAQTYNLKIGLSTAEKLKNTVGSLIPHDHQSFIVQGRDITSGKPRQVAVYSEDIVRPISVYVNLILEYAELVLRKLPEEVSANMCRNGVYLAGGVCALAGLGDYVQERLQMDAHVADNPQMAIVLGGGRVLGNPALLNKLQMQ